MSDEHPDGTISEGEEPTDIVYIDGNDADLEATCNEIDCFERVWKYLKPLKILYFYL